MKSRETHMCVYTCIYIHVVCSGCYWCTCMYTALERQKASLEEVAERTLDWRLRDKEREMQQELSYRVSENGAVLSVTFE